MVPNVERRRRVEDTDALDGYWVVRLSTCVAEATAISLRVLEHGEGSRRCTCSALPWRLVGLPLQHVALQVLHMCSLDEHSYTSILGLWLRTPTHHLDWPPRLPDALLAAGPCGKAWTVPASRLRPG